MPRCAGQTPGGFIKSLFLVVFFEVVFEVMFWSNLGTILGSFLVPILVKKSTPKTRADFIHLGKPFRSHFRSISGTFWCHFGRISGARTVSADIPKTMKNNGFSMVLLGL